MNILMIDTSTDNAIVAVRAGDRFSRRISHSRAAHSGIIFSHIDETLAETGITIHDIQLIGTGTGPGSFTGLRIAVSTSRMIAQLQKIPLVGLHSQYLYASGLTVFPDAAVRQGDYLLPAFDAKKSRVFAGLYREGEAGIETVLTAGDYYPSEIANLISEGDRVVACGSGAAFCKEALQGDSTAFFSIEDFLPDAESMSEAFLGAYEKNPQQYADYSTTLPYYARKSDAEILHVLKKSEGKS